MLEDLLSRRRAAALREEIGKPAEERRDTATVLKEVNNSLLFTTPEGTRSTYHHTGFTGIGGFAMAKILGSVRTRMLTVGVPALLAERDETGALRPDTTLRLPQPR